jgi:hypothetical protein
MLLSDAIRKGCETTTKGAGSPSGYRPRISETGRACVLGAALIGGTSADEFGDLYDEWNCLRVKLKGGDVPPTWQLCYYVNPNRIPDLLEVIYRINDWTPASREAVAEWIDDLHARGVIDARHVSDLPAEEPEPAAPALDEAEALLS